MQKKCFIDIYIYIYIYIYICVQRGLRTTENTKGRLQQKKCKKRKAIGEQAGHKVSSLHPEELKGRPA